MLRYWLDGCKAFGRGYPIVGSSSSLKASFNLSKKLDFEEGLLHYIISHVVIPKWHAPALYIGAIAN